MTASVTPRERAGRTVTSRVQDGLWFLDRLAPHSPAYRICRAYRITGKCDVDAVRAAWLAVVARHEVLRTALVDAGGHPVQRVAAQAPGSFTLIDLSHLVPAVRGSHADRLCAALAADPVSLADGPLARLTVLRLGESEHRAVLVLHRAVADERSASIVLAELSAFYAGGAPAAAPAPRYADYARWQREQDGTAARRRALHWWTAALTPPPRPVALPAERDRAAAPAGPGGTLRFDWGPDVASALDALCRAQDVPPLAVLLAALQAVLHRYGGEDPVAVGVPASVRPAAFAQVVGPCENLLVLSGDLAGAPTFRELVARAASTVRDALEHRDLPFADLVRAIDPDRDPGRVPLCDVVLSVREEPERELVLPGAEVHRHDVHTGAAEAAVVLTVDRVAPAVAGTLRHRTDVLDRAAAEVVLDQVGTLLAAGLATPGARVHGLPMDGPERARATAAAADRLTGSRAGAPGQPVHELIRAHAEREPSAVAVSWSGGQLRYAELERDTALLAGVLDAHGVAGSAVAVRMAHGPHQLAASLGALRAGAHLVWFGTGDAGERGRAVLAELRPPCLLREDSPDSADPAAGDALAGWYRDELGGTVLDVAALLRDAGGTRHPAPSGAAAASLEDVVYVAYTSGSTGKPKGIAQTHAAFAQFVTWMAGALELGPGSRVAQWVAPEHDPSLCEVFATLVAGGTLCAVPEKIRVHPEKFLDWLARERITFLQTVPSFARELLKVITSTGAADRLTDLRRLVLMGEALPGELANGLRAALPGVRLTNMYGPTETIAATWCEITGTVEGTVPIGGAIPGRQVLVLDDADRPCPTGVTGEIVIRSPYVADGYVGDATPGPAFRPVDGLADPPGGPADPADGLADPPGGPADPSGGPADPSGGPADPPGGPAEATAGGAIRARPDPSGRGIRCYRTGDLARRRPDGLLEFRGRRDLQVKLLGNRVELAEVEAALAEHGGVAECAVVPVTDRDGLVVQLVAYVVPRRPAHEAATGTPGGPSAWRAHLRRRFGAAMLLVSFETLDGSLPRNVAGKVDRRRLPAPRAAQTGPGGAAQPGPGGAAQPGPGGAGHAGQAGGPEAPPSTWLERAVAETWAELLNVPPTAAAHQSFFAAGGHSLLVPQLVGRIRQRFGVEIPLREFFAHSTVAGMSALIAAAGVPDDPAA